MLTVQAFLEGFLTKWETKKHSVDPDDSGNWLKGVLVGSKYGVTGAALAKHRGVDKVDKSDVAGVTLAEAATIARVTYFDEADFDLLPWGPVVASAVDKCYMSGEFAAVQCLQRAARTTDDGRIGPKTVIAVATANANPELFAQRFADAREAHEAAVIRAKPVKAKYRNGWNNRTKSYLPGTVWWKSWNMDAAPVDTNPDVPVISEGREYADGLSTAEANRASLDAMPPIGKSVTATPEAITTVIVEPNTNTTAVKKAISGLPGNIAGAIAIGSALMLDPNFSAKIGQLTTSIATGQGRTGAVLSILGAALIAYRTRSK